MYLVVILTITAYAASADDADQRRGRHGLDPHFLRCCNKSPASKFVMVEDLQECREISRNPFSCERELCMAKKKNFATDDGKLDTAKLEIYLKNEFETEPELFEVIKSNCINGNLELYGPPDACDLVKMRKCLVTQLIIQCSEWNDEGYCKGTKELVEELAKMYS